MAETEEIVFKRGKKIFKSDDGYGIYIARLRADSSSIIVKGYDIPNAKNCWVTATGKWVIDQKHGKSFDVTYAELEVPQGEKGIISYLRSLKIGLGEKYAAKIYEAFGNRIWSMLDTDASRIEDVEGLPQNIARRLTKKWTEMTVKRSLMHLFANSPDFTSQMAAKVAKKLGSTSVSKISKNPYLLCRLAGMSFKVVDQTAKAMKPEEATPLSVPRISTAFYCVLRTSTVSGHVCLPEEMLLQNSLYMLNHSAYREQLRMAHLKKCLDALVERGWFKRLGDFIYNSSCYEDEKCLTDNLLRLIRAGASGTDYAKIVVGDVLQDYMKEAGIKLAEQQEKAVLAAFLEPVSIVTGGPGTGKTTMTKAILRLDHVINGEDSEPVLLAPTGRAARRLSEATGHPASTVHSAIGYRGEDDVVVADEDAKIKGSIVIVDEASMLDQKIASLLVEKIVDGTRVVFIGDSDQLPSVGAGNVLAEMISSGVIPVTRLEVVFRQTGEHNPILVNSDKIHHGQTDLVYDDKAFSYIETHTENGQIYNALIKYLEYVKRYGIENVMLLNPYRSERKSSVNVTELNRQIQHAYNPCLPEELRMEIGKVIFHRGDRVMQTKNTEMAQNGDIGTIVTVFERENEDDPSQTDIILSVDFSGFRAEYTKEDAQNLTLAYCCTVHKSQGAEYRAVIMIVSNFHDMMLQRNLLYTGITRARERVLLIGHIEGHDSAVARSIRNTKAAVRYTNLANQLKEGAMKSHEITNIADLPSN